MVGGALNAGDSEARRVRAVLRLRLIPRVGDITIRRLIERFGSPEAALCAPHEAFARVAGARITAGRNHREIEAQADEVLRRAESLGVTILCSGGAGYPADLEQLYDPPALLFLRGEVSLLERRAVAVVGARKATPYGRRSAEALGKDLASRGLVVVSGLALGVDAAAHRGALDAPGSTIAVLGSGIDVPYPYANRRLFREIARNGLLVSEFMPGEPPLAHNFPRRNRIIAGLAKGLIVVEAAEKSGALITVNHALDLGREVYALPGSVESEKSSGVHSLIRDGAGILTEVDDLLFALGWMDLSRKAVRVPAAGEDAGAGEAFAAPDDPPGGLGPDAELLWREMREGPVHLDDLLERSALGARRTVAALSLLELSGWVVQGPGRRFDREGRQRIFGG